jgi:hypothetical protein
MSGTMTIPNDPNPALRAELMAALAVLAPQIRGLQDLATMPVSAELHTQISAQIAARTTRQQLIMGVLGGLDAVVNERETLGDNGYPGLPAVSVAGSLFSELQEENSDIAAALAVFTADQITAGPLTTSPNPNPPTQAGP